MKIMEYGIFVYVEGQDYPEYIHWTQKKVDHVEVKEQEWELWPD